MTKAGLAEALKRLQRSRKMDPIDKHGEAEHLVLAFINDPVVRKAYEAIKRQCGW